MKEILLTSSALILALLLLRRVFRRRISRRLQYALWGLVLLRLLVPANLPAVDFSVLSVSQPVRTQVEERLEEEPVYVLPVERVEFSVTKPQEPTVILPLEGRYTGISERGDAVFLTRYAFTLEEAWDLVWKTGMVIMAGWLAASNLRFWHKLRKDRIPLELADCKRPVYLVEEGLASPCLFGLFRPAVYLTPAALESPDGLRHVLAHEETHARQLDPLWALLRSVCLAVYWFDPLVWWAAAASREDCELACDEGALKRLGEAERIPYGQTLLRLIPLKRAAGGVLLTATTMTSDKKRLKERITRIAENRKMKAAALCAALAVTAAVCAVTFTGCAAAEAEEPPDVPDTPAVTEPDAPSSTLPEAPVVPAVPTPPADMEGVLPSGAPALTVSLAGLTPCGPLPVATIPADDLFSDHHEDHHGEHQDRRLAGGGCRTTEKCGTFAWSHEGNIYVSSQDLALSSFPGDYFLTFPEQEYAEEEFTGLFGYDGVKISYTASPGSSYYCTFNDFYVFTEDPDGGANVFLLARVYGEPQLIDLDGNGTMELVGTGGLSQAQIIFQRDGALYEADIGSLLHEHWSGSEYMEAYGWEGRHLDLWGFVPDEGNDGSRITVTAWRQLYFDGENLLLYRRTPGPIDHVTAGVQAPDAVLSAAMEAAAEELESWRDPGSSEEAYLPEWDDYRITGLTPVYPTAEDPLPEGLDLAVYSVAFELHTATPERVGLAGGIYVGEDGWVGGFGEGSLIYLVFQVLPDGSYVCLDSIGDYASPGSPMFVEWLNAILADHGLPQISAAQ